MKLTEHERRLLALADSAIDRDDDRSQREAAAKKRQRQRWTPERRAQENARVLAWKRAHPDRVKAYARADYQQHRDRFLRNTKVWRAKHPERALALNREYQKRRRDRAIQIHGRICAACGKRFLLRFLQQHGCCSSRCLEQRLLKAPR